MGYDIPMMSKEGRIYVQKKASMYLRALGQNEY